MPFPVSRSGVIGLGTEWTAAGAQEHLESLLSELGATELRSHGGVVTFRVPGFLTGGLLFLVDGGEVALMPAPPGEPTALRYRLSFRRAAIIGAVLVLGWLGVGVRLIEGEWAAPNVFGTMLFLVFAYCWIFGSWYFIVPRWFARRLAPHEGSKLHAPAP